MDKINISYFKTPYGELVLGDFRNELCLCDWRYRKMRPEIDKRIKNGLNAEFTEELTPPIELLKLQLNEYFEGKRKAFELPLLMVGSDFQKSVWNELLKIPFGKTVSYLKLSQQLGNEKAIRAVASANGANALSILVPCHRIIGSDGSLTGYAGGLTTKKKLLQLEGSLKTDSQLKLFS
jgi:methylated-DNA-[protein]-cysteine S-methyltransferase